MIVNQIIAENHIVCVNRQNYENHTTLVNHNISETQKPNVNQNEAEIQKHICEPIKDAKKKEKKERLFFSSCPV